MANIQYIGARYVPIVFTNPDDGTSNWKSGIAYEALTIVTVNGDSYTSKKAVPDGIGTPSANPEYWVKTGDFNASLVSLQNRVYDLETQNGNETLKTKAQTLSGAVNEVNSATNKGLSANQIDRPFLYEAISYYTGDSSYTSMQGGCYNSDSDIYVMGFIKGDESACMLVEVAPDMTTIIRRTPYTNGELRHCNDITYNPVTKQYVIAGYGNNSTNMSVILINALTMAFVEEITVLPVAMDPNEALGKICYDAANDVYYGMSNRNLFTYDNAFNLINNVTFDYASFKTHDYAAITVYPLQSIDLINGKLAAVYSIQNSNMIWSASIVIYNLDGSIETTHNVNLPIAYCEAEAICYHDGVLRILSGAGLGFFYTDVVLQNTPLCETGFSINQVGAALASIDIDDVKVCGHYTVHDSDTATITNSPFNHGFELYVISSFAGLTQIAMLNATENIFAIRRCNYLGIWNSWQYNPNLYIQKGKSYTVKTCFTGFLSNTGVEFNMYIPCDLINSTITANDITVDSLGVFLVSKDYSGGETLSTLTVYSKEIIGNTIKITFRRADNSPIATGPSPAVAQATSGITFTVAS